MGAEATASRRGVQPGTTRAIPRAARAAPDARGEQVSRDRGAALDSAGVPRPPALRSPGLRLLAAAAIGAGALSCGASIQAVYEGDVRFERCMALDSRPDVKPTIRRACWEEWVTFYTFGQTRDRIDYAHLREKQLVEASDFDEGDVPEKRVGAVPDPTSALAPPPMMLATDGGTPAAPKPDASVEERAPGAECAAECEIMLESCKRDCKTAPCEKACSGKYKRCMRRCF